MGPGMSLLAWLPGAWRAEAWRPGAWHQSVTVEDGNTDAISGGGGQISLSDWLRRGAPAVQRPRRKKRQRREEEVLALAVLEIF